MDDLESLQRTVTRAAERFSELDEYAAGSGFDLQELRAATGEVAGLLRAYRAGELDPGPETGEFIEGAILRQSKTLAHLPDAFQRWLADEQARFNACMTWASAANAHTAGLARRGGDAVEQDLAAQLSHCPVSEARSE